MFPLYRRELSDFRFLEVQDIFKKINTLICVFLPYSFFSLLGVRHWGGGEGGSSLFNERKFSVCVSEKPEGYLIKIKNIYIYVIFFCHFRYYFFISEGGIRLGEGSPFG